MNYESAIDIGTGAGIPGVILGIALPKTKFTLVDSTEKKINFINEFVKNNGIDNVTAVASRAEELELKADLVTSRAVAALPKLLELASHLVNINGEVIFYKGRNLEEEKCPKLLGTIEELGLEYIETKDYDLNPETKRSFIKYKKIKENKKGYPRI
jgi:16S rRNA (guanine527-N7)-methyltransferase